MQRGTSSSWPVFAIGAVLMAVVFAFREKAPSGDSWPVFAIGAVFAAVVFAFRAKAPSADAAPSTAADAAPSAAAAKVRRGQSPGRKPAQPGPVEAERRAAPDEALEPNVNSALAGMSEEEVEAWLAELGHPDAAKRFREGAISGDVLADLTDADLEKMGIAPIGERKRVLALVKAGLKSGPEAVAARSRATQRKPSGVTGSPG
jgi:hypothetical protein